MGRVFEGSDSPEKAGATDGSRWGNRISGVRCERIYYGPDVARGWWNFNRGGEGVGESAKELKGKAPLPRGSGALIRDSRALFRVGLFLVFLPGTAEILPLFLVFFGHFGALVFVDFAIFVGVVFFDERFSFGFLFLGKLGFVGCIGGFGSDGQGAGCSHKCY